MEAELLEEKEIKPFGEYDAVGSWHLKIKPVTVGNTRLVIKNMITGCGLAQMYGVSNLLGTEATPTKFKELFNHCKTDGIGAIIATLGQNYYNSHNHLLKLGFDYIAEYTNYRHGTDTQRMYILKL